MFKTFIKMEANQAPSSWCRTFVAAKKRSKVKSKTEERKAYRRYAHVMMWDRGKIVASMVKYRKA